MILIKIVKWILYITVFPIISLIVFVVGATLAYVIAGTIRCLLWLIAAVLQIAVVVGILLFIAWMASKGWITI